MIQLKNIRTKKVGSAAPATAEVAQVKKVVGEELRNSAAPITAKVAWINYKKYMLLWIKLMVSTIYGENKKTRIINKTVTNRISCKPLNVILLEFDTWSEVQFLNIYGWNVLSQNDVHSNTTHPIYGTNPQRSVIK